MTDLRTGTRTDVPCPKCGKPMTIMRFPLVRYNPDEPVRWVLLCEDNFPMCMHHIPLPVWMDHRTAQPSLFDVEAP